MTLPPIRIANAAIVRDGELLIVRKKNTEIFIQPGGKIEPGELPISALLRELNEELGITLLPSQLTPFGTFSAAAAHQPERIVESTGFLAEWSGNIEPRAEIEEYAWLPIHNDTAIPIAPLIRDTILPLLRERLGA